MTAALARSITDVTQRYCGLVPEGATGLSLAVQQYNVSLTDAITAITAAPAAVLGLKQKGRIAVGLDADLVLLRHDDLTIDQVFAMGKQLVAAGQPLVKGTFEP